MTATHTPAPGAAPGSAPDPAPGSWEAVLAAVEADLHRTEQLLGPSVVAHVPALAPAELMLPADGPELPAFEHMPPVPPELADRIKELRARIIELQADLERCLAVARRADHPALNPFRHGAGRPLLGSAVDQQPHFVDRRA